MHTVRRDAILTIFYSAGNSYCFHIATSNHLQFVWLRWLPVPILLPQAPHSITCLLYSSNNLTKAAATQQQTEKLNRKSLINENSKYKLKSNQSADGEILLKGWFQNPATPRALHLIHHLEPRPSWGYSIQMMCVDWYF